LVYLWGWRLALDFVQSFIRWCSTGMPTPDTNEYTKYAQYFMNLPAIAGSNSDIKRFLYFSQFTITVLMVTPLCALSPLLARERFIRYGLAVFTAVFLAICMMTKTQLTQTACVLLLIYLTFCCVEYSQEKKWRAHTFMPGKKIAFWLSPFLLLFLLFLLVLPANQKPYDWKFARRIWEKIEDSRIWISQRWGKSEEDFQMAFTGFSLPDEVGGNITNNHQTQILLTNESSTTGGLYLAGAVYNTFNGKGWEYTAKEEPWVPWADTMESIYGAYGYDSELVSDYFTSASITITYEKMKTHYLFAPTKTYLLSLDPNTYDEQNAGFTFQKPAGHGTTYKVNYYRMNLGNDAFWEFAEAASTNAVSSQIFASDQAKDFQTAMNKYFPKSLVELTQTQLSTHTDSIQSQYAAYPQLSHQIENYLTTLLEGANTPIEICKRIETKLREYTYTQTPGNIPEGESFLDYFLMTKQEGYCTYFATAFALLARAADIPTRYVQGYCIPKIPARGDTSEITSSMAHAWPEAYIEGIGWIPFEPTPGYAAVRYQKWNTRSQQEAITAKASVPNSEDETPPSPEAQDLPETWQNEPSQYTIEIPIGVILFFIGMLLTAALLIFALDHLIRRHRYDKLDTTGKLNSQVHKTLTLLATLGYPMAPFDTITELCTRLQTAKLPAETIAFLNAFEQARYGTAPIDTSLLTTAEHQTALLLTTLKHQNSRTYYRYLLLPPRQ
jgi:hypothetical protein